MKTKSIIISGALLLAASSLSFAADTNTPPDRPGNGQQDGQRRPPPHPLLHLLDTNRDGVISSDEIANAPAALKALDKNGDGQLTADELRPPRGPGGPGGPRDGKGKKGGGDDSMPPPPPPDDAK